MKKRTKGLILFSLSLILLLFAGCEKKDVGDHEKKIHTEVVSKSEEQLPSGEEKTIKVLVSGSMNPEEASPIVSAGEFFLYEMVYEPLVRYGREGKIEPGLAEHWEISENGKEYTFHLRKGVHFTDGTTFNAESALSNIKRWNPESFSTPLVDAQKIDDYTIKLVFKDNCYPVLIELTYPRPYRMAAESSFDKGEFIKMVGTGPWMVESYVPQVEVVMVPNPNYYGEKPKLDKIVFKKVSDGQSRMMALQSGEADLSLADLPAESLDLVEKSDALEFLNLKGTQGFYYIFNQENPLLQNRDVRLALNYALDKKNIAEAVFNGGALAAEGVLPPTVPYVTEKNSPGYPYDLEKAKKALENAGYRDVDGDGILEKDGEPLSLRLIFQAEEYANWKYLCEFTQAELKKIGVDIRLEQRDRSAYYDAIWKNRDFDLIIYRTYEDSWNPHGFLRSLFYQKDGNPGISWHDSRLNKELDLVLLTQDEKERQGVYDEIFTLMHDEAMCAPICYPIKRFVYNTRLLHVEPASTSYEGIRWQLLDVK